MIFFSIIIIFFYLSCVVVILEKIYNGQPLYLLLYLVLFLPFYTITQVIVFDAFENIFLVNSIKYSKDFVIISSFILYLIGTKESFLKRTFKLTLLDWLIITFLSLVLIYLIIPLGEATYFSKLIYTKNVFFIGIVYYFGRISKLKRENWNNILKILIGLSVLSFLVAFSENIIGIHLHSFLNFSDYNLLVKDIDSAGNYGLNWTFETQSTSPRYASIFADPLEFSASLILFLSISLWFLLHSKYIQNKFYFMILLAIIIGSFLLAMSRASILAGLLVFILALYISKNYQVIFCNTVFFISACIYLYFFSENDTRYMIEDTLFFRNSSSLGHLVEWIEGLLTIIENPFGIGLAMSGNASGVDQSLKIGGENQFLIYGVQMGVISIMLYVVILFKAIFNSIKVYMRSSCMNEKSIGFITGLTKFGLLIPLLTANAELYLFVALFSWYLVGHIESLHSSSNFDNNLKIEKS